MTLMGNLTFSDLLKLSNLTIHYSCCPFHLMILIVLKNRLDYCMVEEVNKNRESRECKVKLELHFW